MNPEPFESTAAWNRRLVSRVAELEAELADAQGWLGAQRVVIGWQAARLATELALCDGNESRFAIEIRAAAIGDKWTK